MEIVTAVAYAEVHDAYLRDHPVERDHEANTNMYGEENLERADRIPGGWWRVRLSRADVLRVVLPWHLSEGGELELVPRSGLTVGEAAERVRSGGAAWTAANPVCAAKLRLLRWSPFLPVFLSTAPIDHSDYGDLSVRAGLIHLDGLHRMLAWELAGRLPLRTVLDGYLAGDPGVAAGPVRRARAGRTGDEAA
ncbi:DUF6309 family protein [Kitasatospora sp. Ki12]|uniref:DUF6309 family protein n=1 Tax=Kitasatospora xanthocidica TaxID=83382 RepID=UPI0016775443|nr:DUF6309 family protein [Kitasatospora xanthocidica]GHF56748.1 hypothetical protein GCM10018790_38450 [Kitasatospora xanthocidica]